MAENQNNKVHLASIELHLVDNCNLNCKGCDHFCPLIKQSSIHSAACLKRDMKVLASKIELRNINLLGGEPLLHPDIVEILDHARSSFPAISITLATNGILLPAMDVKFWDACLGNEIDIAVSDYPQVKNKEKIIETLEKHNVKYRIAGRPQFYASLRLKPTGRTQECYKLCHRKHCVLVHDGRLYPCATAAFVRNFNEAYNENIPTHSGLDIYTATPEEIRTITRMPCRTCDYCDVENMYMFDSMISTGKKSDWLIPCNENEIKAKRLANIINQLDESLAMSNDIVELVSLLNEIDWQQYKRTISDVDTLNMTPLQHYLKIGCKQNRDVIFSAFSSESASHE